MNTAEIIFEQVKALPEPMALEVLNFIGYLKEKPERSVIENILMAQEESLKEIWDNPEDEIWNDA